MKNEKKQESENDTKKKNKKAKNRQSSSDGKSLPKKMRSKMDGQGKKVSNPVPDTNSKNKVSENKNNNKKNENDNKENKKSPIQKINTKKSAPFSISFGQKKIPPGNINYNNNNNINQEDIKKKQSNVFSHQSPLRYNRPFQNNNMNLNLNNKNHYRNKTNIYSVFIKNDLDTSQLYDLHKANWDVSKPNIPTAKLRRIKLGNPFAVGNKHKTNFGHVYSAGGIPCRIEHGNVNMKLVWSIPPESLEYDPTLIICFEGLLETLHPYSFAAKQCVRELLTAKGAAEKVLPILGRLIPFLKNALTCDNPDTFVEAMNVVEMLSDLVGEHLNPYLHFFLQSINKRSFNLKYKERVFDLMRTLEQNGGEEALKEIKKKVPTYMSTIL